MYLLVLKLTNRKEEENQKAIAGFQLFQSSDIDLRSRNRFFRNGEKIYCVSQREGVVESWGAE